MIYDLIIPIAVRRSIAVVAQVKEDRYTDEPKITSKQLRGSAKLIRAFKQDSPTRSQLLKIYAIDPDSVPSYMLEILAQELSDIADEWDQFDREVYSQISLRKP